LNFNWIIVPQKFILELSFGQIRIPHENIFQNSNIPMKKYQYFRIVGDLISTNSNPNVCTLYSTVNLTSGEFEVWFNQLVYFDEISMLSLYVRSKSIPLIVHEHYLQNRE
jgi:hypothetical protein